MHEANIKIGLIGGGNMGEVMLAAILEAGLSAPEAIRVSDISESRRLDLRSKYGVVSVESNLEVLPGSDVVMLAIKPQNLASAAVELNGKLRRDQLLLSIIAGASIATLSRGFDHQCIVRVMPNTPARIGEGISVWTASPEVTEQQRQTASSILRCMGKEIFVEDEDFIDMATAISGSGPAYVFLFMESLISAAEEIGLPAETARQLVLQTVIGAARYAEESGRPLLELRWAVTSPGGTTTEAMAQFERGKFSELILLAIQAAYEKAKKLGM